MSRRIETRTDIRDQALAEEALNSAGIKYSVNGNIIRMESGKYNNSYIDLSNGSIVGDSDFRHSEKLFGLLRQHYAEAQVRDVFLKNGTMVEDREIDHEGNVVLTWSMS
jgi:hypothetical protein